MTDSQNYRTKVRHVTVANDNAYCLPKNHRFLAGIYAAVMHKQQIIGPLHLPVPALQNENGVKAGIINSSKSPVLAITKSVRGFFEHTANHMNKLTNSTIIVEGLIAGSDRRKSNLISVPAFDCTGLIWRRFLCLPPAQKIAFRDQELFDYFLAIQKVMAKN